MVEENGEDTTGRWGVRRFAFAACVDVVVDRVAECLLDSVRSF